MLAAMMLPTALPVLWLLRAGAGAAGRRRRLVALAAAGYLAAWAGFGLVAHLADAGVAAGVRQSAVADLQRLGARRGGAGGSPGAFQFSGLKRRCLERCRSPLALVMQHWRGARPRARPGGSGSRTGSSASAAAGR